MGKKTSRSRFRSGVRGYMKRCMGCSSGGAPGHHRIMGRYHTRTRRMTAKKRSRAAVHVRDWDGAFGGLSCVWLVVERSKGFMGCLVALGCSSQGLRRAAVREKLAILGPSQRLRDASQSQS